MKIAVIGAGYWGSKLVNSIKGHNVKVIDVKDGTKLDEAFDCQAAIVATPAMDHYSTTMKLLKQGMHCLVEKPIALKYSEVEMLKVTAQEYNVKLMAGHVLCYTDLIKNMKDTVKKENVLHIESRRLAWGRIQYDISPIPHFAPHDVAVLDHVFDGAMPKQVYSKGYRFDSRQFPDYVISDLDYGDFTVQLQMGWYYPKKVRTIRTITNQGHHTWDDVENTWTFEANYMSGKYQEQNPSQNYKVAPNRTFTPVENEIQHFINCIENNIEPITGSDHALRVTHIVNYLEQSLKIQEPCTITY
tara:strand:+ start:4263 stop:5165 length:903 start_codon:yes stop_codon:yes gene_type:complete